jgi:CBS domain-containing protein
MSLENDLQQEQVIHLDIGRFTMVTSGTSVKEAVERMRNNNHNCVIITENGKLAGIFTDRDLMNRVIGSPKTWNNPIDAVMTTSPMAVQAKDPAYQALELMDKKHFRNVPVLDSNGQVVGNLTHYSVIKYLADRFQESVYNQPPEPNRVTRHRAGA